MPIVKTTNHNNYQLAVWEISETTTNLICLLKKHTSATVDFQHSKNEVLIKQKIAVKLLLYHFFETYQLFYDEKGKPFLTNGIHLSISHSNNYAVVLLNKTNPCGVDIEKVAQKINRIKYKFLSETELKTINNNDIEQLTIFWSAKEALYKYYGKKEVIFNEHLFVEQLVPKSQLKGIISIKNTPEIIALTAEKINDFVLVYTTS